MVRRVPLDFDWPLRKIWDGFLKPKEDECSVCADQHHFLHTPVGQDIYDALHRNCDLTQEEADFIWNDQSWKSVGLPEMFSEKPTAAQLNHAQNTGFLFDRPLDEVAIITLVERRCEAMGESFWCQACNGTGNASGIEDEWEPQEPPTGEGWQAWEDVSE